MNVLSTSYDVGLREFMLKVYGWMTLGLSLTGAVSWAMYATGATTAMLASPALTWLIILSPFAAILGMWLLPRNPLIHGALFLGLSAAMGASLSTIFLTYKLGLIFQAFFATAAGFAGMSLYGYTTRTDMSGMGTFFLMALFGMLGLLILNMFITSTLFTLAVSAAGLVLFAGLTAYDTQKIKNLYVGGYGDEVMAISGALELYLDFINMFLYVLRILAIFGDND